MRRCGWLFLAVCLGVVIVLGCSPATDPGGNGTVEWDRTSPDRLLNFFANAYENKNIEEYDESLDDSFRFHFTSEVADDMGLPSDQQWWGKGEDVASTRNMFEDPDVTTIEIDLPIIVDWYQCTDDTVTGLEGLCALVEPDIKVTIESGEEPVTYWVNETRLDVMVVVDKNNPELWTILMIQEFEKTP